MRSWSRRRIVVTSLVVVTLVWLGVVAWLLWSAKTTMRAGSDDLRRVRRDASISSLVQPSSRADLAAARSQFDDADDTLHHPALIPLRVIPVASRHLRAAQKLASAASDGTEAADAALRDLDALTDRPRSTGPQRLETLDDLAAVAGRADAALGALDPGSPDALIGPLADAVTELDGQRDDARAGARQLEATSRALRQVLQGPDPYLLLGANNAEMRNGSGMFLSASELAFDDGRLSLGEVRPTADLVLPAGTVPVGGDLAANWPWLDPGRDLRNLGLTADFPQSARVAVRNWEAVPGGGPVAGVLVLDVDAVRSLLRVVGPVTVDGIRYTPQNVRGELLRAQYQRFSGDRSKRRDQLGDVARAIFDRIEAGKWELADLATELSDAVSGRHLMIWSRDAQEQRAWSSVGADGHLTNRTMAAALLNRSGAKLDSWIKTSVAVRTEAVSAGRREVTLTYRITNTAPSSGPAYLVGPNVEGLRAGDHRGLAVVNLPAGTTGVRLSGGRTFLSGGDGPTVVIGGEVTVRRGQTVTVTVTGLLPKGLDRVVIEPSARIPKATWTVDGVAVARDRRRTVGLGA